MMGSRRVQFSFVPAVVLALALPVVSVASTPSPPPPDTPAISQYVEQVPTSHGGSSPGVGRAQIRALSRQAAAKLLSHPDAMSHLLEKIATSSTYGAPQRTFPKPGKQSAEPKASSALSAVVSAVSDSGGSHVVWLLLTVVFATVAMVAIAVPRRVT